MDEDFTKSDFYKRVVEILDEINSKENRPLFQYLHSYRIDPHNFYESDRLDIKFLKSLQAEIEDRCEILNLSNGGNNSFFDNLLRAYLNFYRFLASEFNKIKSSKNSKNSLIEVKNNLKNHLLDLRFPESCKSELEKEIDMFVDDFLENDE